MKKSRKDTENAIFGTFSINFCKKGEKCLTSPQKSDTILKHKFYKGDIVYSVILRGQAIIKTGAHYLGKDYKKCKMGLLRDRMTETNISGAIAQTSGTQLIDMNIDVIQISNYFVQLFYQTQQKYSCTRTKIGKLTSIAAFICAKNNIRLFSERIYKYEDCGTILWELNEYPLSLYDFQCGQTTCSIQSNEIIIPAEEINESLEYPGDYKSDVDDRTKALLKDVFMRFGALPTKNIGKMINGFIDAILSYEEDEMGIVDLYKMRDLVPTDEMMNPMLSYIIGYKLNWGNEL